MTLALILLSHLMLNFIIRNQTLNSLIYKLPLVCIESIVLKGIKSFISVVRNNTWYIIPLVQYLQQFMFTLDLTKFIITSFIYILIIKSVLTWQSLLGSISTFAEAEHVDLGLGNANFLFKPILGLGQHHWLKSIILLILLPLFLCYVDYALSSQISIAYGIFNFQLVGIQCRMLYVGLAHVRQVNLG